MTRVPGGDETEMPVFDADPSAPGLRAPGRVGGSGHRAGRARGLGVAVAALILMTAGIAIGGMLVTPAPTGSPIPSERAEATATVSLATPRPTPSPIPLPTPAVTPAVACGPVPSGAGDVGVVLSAPGVEPVAGAPEGAWAPAVSVGLGDAADLAVVGDACSISWQVTLLSAAGEPVDGETVANPGDDPAYAAQNRWVVRVPVGDHRLVATLRFGPGIEVVREWRVTGLGFTVPDTFLVDADGTRVPALPGCGLSISLANGFVTADSCGSVGYPEGLRALRVPAWSRVALEIPGWSIVSWNGTCGRIETDQFGAQSFMIVEGCSLGGYVAGSYATPPAPAEFLARPGERVVRLEVGASRNGDTFSVPMYALVSGE